MDFWDNFAVSWLKQTFATEIKIEENKYRFGLKNNEQRVKRLAITAMNAAVSKNQWF